MLEVDRDFSWDVCQGSYVCVRSNQLRAGPVEESTVLALQPYEQPEGGFAFRPYRPLQDSPALFRIFARIEGTTKCIEGFAIEYGSLTTRAADVLPGATLRAGWPTGKPTSEVFPTSETLGDWAREIYLMRRLVELIDACESEFAAASKRYDAGLGDATFKSKWLHDSHPELPSREPATPPDVRVEAFLADDSYQPPRNVRNVLWPEGPHAVEDYLHYIEAERVLKESALTLRPDRKTPGWPPKAHLTPTTLLGAMWLQFLAWIGSRTEFRQCKVCGRWFKLARGVSRIDRVFCSRACRSKAYRDRQDEARRMRTAGHSLEDIADALGSTVPTVKGWITGVKDVGPGGE
jgi:hypothetical protein